MNADLDLSQCWARTMAMLSENAQLLSAIAGVFFILPSFAVSLFIGEPDVPPNIASPEAAYGIMLQFYADNWLAILATSIASIIGFLAMQVLMLDSSRPTVGAALGIALTLTVSYLIANLITSIAAAIGLVLLIIPGIYISLRLILIGPAMANERLMNPLAALARSWQLTKGNVLRIFLFLLIVFVVLIVSITVVGLVAGILVGLSGGTGVVGMLGTFINAAASAVATVVIAACYCAVYRELAPDHQAMADAFE